MKDARVASRYAKALINLAVERNELDAAKKDIDLVYSTCLESNELQLMLQSPIISVDKKQTILDKIFNHQVGDLVRKFIAIVVSKNREELIPAITKEFLNQYRIHNGFITAEVTTAIELDDELRTKLLSIVGEENDRKVELVETVDPSIIGGLVVRIGDRQFDASIKRKINDLKKQFDRNLYLSNL